MSSNRVRGAAYRARRVVRQAAGSKRRAIKRAAGQVIAAEAADQRDLNPAAFDDGLEGIDLSDPRVRQALGVAYGPDNAPS